MGSCLFNPVTVAEKAPNVGFDVPLRAVLGPVNWIGALGACTTAVIMPCELSAYALAENVRSLIEAARMALGTPSTT